MQPGPTSRCDATPVANKLASFNFNIKVKCIFLTFLFLLFNLDQFSLCDAFLVPQVHLLILITTCHVFVEFWDGDYVRQLPYMKYYDVVKRSVKRNRVECESKRMHNMCFRCRIFSFCRTL